MALSANVYADIDWSRAETNNSNYVIDFDDTTTGSIPGGSNFGFDSSPSDATLPTASFTAPVTPSLEGEGDSVSLIYQLSELVDGGSFSMAYAWQFNDYEVTISGGNGVIDGSTVTFGNSSNTNTGVAGVDFDIIGDGTSSIGMDKLLDTGSFYGSFSVTGTWDTLEIKQKYNTDGSGSGLVDTRAIATTKSLPIAAVPEPSSTSLLMLGSVGLLLRRKR